MATNIYAVSVRKNGGKSIRMPPDAEGYYHRDVLENGTVIFYPVRMDVDKSAIATLVSKEARHQDGDPDTFPGSPGAP